MGRPRLTSSNHCVQPKRDEGEKCLLSVDHCVHAKGNVVQPCPMLVERAQATTNMVSPETMSVEYCIV